LLRFEYFLKKKKEKEKTSFLFSRRVSWDQPIQTNLSGDIKLFTTGLPGSGAVLSFILNILDGYGFTPASMIDFNATTLTYHRMIETFKYAYALRADLGDGAFTDMTEVINIKDIINNKYRRYNPFFLSKF